MINSTPLITYHTTALLKMALIRHKGGNPSDLMECRIFGINGVDHATLPYHFFLHFLSDPN